MSAPRKTSLKLDTDIKTRLERLAEARRRSADWLMREAIEQYIEREERRDSLRQDALAAWAAYQATGLHVTAEEADNWLARLEAGDDRCTADSSLRLMARLVRDGRCFTRRERLHGRRVPSKNRMPFHDVLSQRDPTESGRSPCEAEAKYLEEWNRNSGDVVCPVR